MIDENIRLTGVFETSTETTDVLANAFLKSFETPIMRLNAQSESLQEEQLNWIDNLESQNRSLDELDREMQNLATLFSKIPQYINKCNMIKRDMYIVFDLMTDLKERCAELKKKKDAILAKEARLVAQPSSYLTQKTSTVTNPEKS